ncbi:DUF4337 family protein [Sphingomonas solaris]|uniref:DUF4337 domain-containing protein n=1 Tax=Alterirhizorhabdus solaris TaxID=2529389 RepID=A0A558R7W6_9SPHN|nr:DUF4337 family protein [Sphingomonas solaris]TVV75485.1 DUF4337 domain-containing protein [Sphingomonas solaris]
MEANDIPGTGSRRLNRAIALTVVILSVSMALTKIKDDNIVQAMQADTAAKVDGWDEYQATRVKLHIEEVAATGYRLLPGPPAAGAARAAEANVARYSRETVALKAQAAAAAADYDRQGYRDDQFDLADGFASIALAVTAIATLLESWGLLGLAWTAGAAGIAFSMAGFVGWALHPGALVAFLT